MTKPERPQMFFIPLSVDLCAVARQKVSASYGRAISSHHAPARAVCSSVCPLLDFLSIISYAGGEKLFRIFRIPSAIDGNLTESIMSHQIHPL
ncbi:Uncharacterized protein APZ42_016283 [Daphnia magna]|uniref:Uncharacterized protein n=1 Tax=Daphnia magna TaxID=35525 RepID=A0A165AID6_9CRUS|nr:Uncharacterized protein APZ42_016283 [Daphnia magna]